MNKHALPRKAWAGKASQEDTNILSDPHLYFFFLCYKLYIFLCEFSEVNRLLADYTRIWIIGFKAHFVRRRMLNSRILCRKSFILWIELKSPNPCWSARNFEKISIIVQLTKRRNSAREQTFIQNETISNDLLQSASFQHSNQVFSIAIIEYNTYSLRRMFFIIFNFI